MGMDIRLPIGLMFTVFGLLLTAFGVFADKSIYERSLGINVNFGWGLVLLAFGAFMLFLGRRRATVPDAVKKETARTEAGPTGAVKLNTRSGA